MTIGFYFPSLHCSHPHCLFSLWICFWSCLSLTEDTSMFPTTWSWLGSVEHQSGWKHCHEQDLSLVGESRQWKLPGWMLQGGQKAPRNTGYLSQLNPAPMKLWMPLCTSTSSPLVSVWRNRKSSFTAASTGGKARSITNCFQVFSVLFANLENFCTRFQTLLFLVPPSSPHLLDMLQINPLPLII